MKFFRISVFIFLSLAIAAPTYACRFWVGVGQNVNGQVIDHLLSAPHSLKNISEEYPDGWSVGYYHDGKPVITRSAKPAHTDQDYDQAVVLTSLKSSDVVFSHLRKASSGCVNGVANPHPFIIEGGGKTWAFGHNGGMKKQILIDLIGEDYLKKHPPAICMDNPPNTWIDSELYFIYLLKVMEENRWNVTKGLKRALLKLYDVIPVEDRYLNFFLTDGKTVWVFRKGNSLFYKYDPIASKTYVASSVPDEEQGGWKEFPINSIAEIVPGSRPEFILIKYFDS